MIATSKEPLRDFYGVIIGWIESDNTGDQQIRDFYGTILGTYDSKMNVTRDFYGKILYKGNMLTALLNNKK